MSEYLSIDERFVRKLHEIAEARIADEDFGISQLSEAMGISRVTLYRKLKKSVNKPAHQFLHELRLKRSKELLDHKTGTVAEIAYQVGFRSDSYFNKCFREFYGYPPGEVLKGKHSGHIVRQTEKEGDPNLKTIAVLPLKNDGPPDKLDYVAEGLREEIINILNLIGDIYVISRISSDTYRYSGKNLKEIARELNVNYILEGSYQTYRTITRIRLQLIKAATDFHLWSQPYECKLDDGNLFEIQKDVALRVAGQLKAIITPEEKIHLSKTGTEHPAALTHFQNGIGYSMLARNQRKSRYSDNAMEEFKKAVCIDPEFADAWLKMTEIFVYNKMWPNRYLTGFLNLQSFTEMLSEANTMLQKANTLGTQNPEITLFVEAIHIRSRADFLDRLNKSIDKHGDTSDHSFYRTLGYICYFKCDYYNAIKYWLTFLRMISGKDTPSVDDFHFIISTISLVGFTEEARKIADVAFKQTNDQVRYKYSLIPIISGKGDVNEFIDLVIGLQEDDPEDPVFANFSMNAHITRRNSAKALLHLQKRVDLMKKNGMPIEPNPYMAWVYHVNGMQNEFKWHCDRILANNIGLKEDVTVPNAAFLFCHLAATFALIEKRDEMYASLDQILQCESALMDVILQLKYAPHFDLFSSEAEFGAILDEVEGKHKSVREKCKKLFHGDGSS
jgi:TolB-like protein